MEDSLRDVETKVSDQIIDYEEYVSTLEATDNDIRSLRREMPGDRSSQRKS